MAEGHNYVCVRAASNFRLLYDAFTTCQSGAINHSGVEWEKNDVKIFKEQHQRLMKYATSNFTKGSIVCVCPSSMSEYLLVGAVCYRSTLPNPLNRNRTF